MDNPNAIPTAQIPVMRINCYHLSLRTSTGLADDLKTAQQVFHAFDLVDPAAGVSEQLQAWLNERGSDHSPTLRHIEIEDRHGLHRFPDQRCGDIFVFCEDSIAFESFTDRDSVLQEPVKSIRKRQRAGRVRGYPA